MSGGRKRILSPFTGRKKRKARNKTREKYIPEEKKTKFSSNRQEIILKSREMVTRILRR